MDEITKTVTRNCVVAWKCPKCARYVASKSSLTAQGAVPLRDLSTNMELDEVRKFLAEQIDRQVFKLDESNDRQEAKVSITNFTLRVSAYEIVKCPHCKCQPKWSAKKESVGGFWKSILIPFGMLLSAVLGMLIGGTISMFLNLDDNLFEVVMFLSAPAGVMGAMYLCSGEWKNRRAVKTEEKHHQPLATFQKDVTMDENDPRTEALKAYINEQPLLSFYAETKSGMNVHVDID